MNVSNNNLFLIKMLYLIRRPMLVCTTQSQQQSHSKQGVYGFTPIPVFSNLSLFDVRVAAEQTLLVFETNR